jgi:diketogulonate reductase-like aldo/keto reductase
MFLYGTAWKEERTEALVRLALQNGFTGIDTANQRRHYFEAAVGEAIKEIPRSTLFLQTKFTYLPSHDERIPYDANAKFEAQVRQSFESSLQHLHTDYLDSYLLHGPSRRDGLSSQDWEVWRAMESLHEEKKARALGISNVAPKQLTELCRKAKVQPAYVQNRCFARTEWDKEVRAICKANGIVYQGFSLLTANTRELLSNMPVLEILKRRDKSLAEIVFAFALQVGMLPLTGTSSAEHMKLDLAASNLSLDEEEIAAIESAGLASN